MIYHGGGFYLFGGVNRGAESIEGFNSVGTALMSTVGRFDENTWAWTRDHENS